MASVAITYHRHNHGDSGEPDACLIPVSPSVEMESSRPAGLERCWQWHNGKCMGCDWPAVSDIGKIFVGQAWHAGRADRVAGLFLAL